ncbi:MAG: CvpA family protein [Oscillospiraceae bacterium]|nr:CvpA family protein [Oscillospiraceae bacterium]
MNKKIRKPINSKIKSLIFTFIVGFIYFYFALPAINLQDESFYGFFFIMAFVYCLSYFVFEGFTRLVGRNVPGAAEENKSIMSETLKTVKIPAFLCVALVIINLGGALLSSVVFRSRAYTKLLPIEEGDFTEDVAEISFDSIPMLDKASATRLATRKLGELSDLVSQFEVVEDSAQINYKGKPVRPYMLRYGDTIKWLNNSKQGIPGYILTNMITQECTLVRLDEGIKYSPYDYFGRNLTRHLRFNYPTFIFDEEIFEIDEDGTPYWICPRIVKTIGLFGGIDTKGAVLVNAVTGECEYYEEVPQWVDHVYSASLIMQQYNYHGKYTNGFLNSIFGQRGVTVTTAGYNYIAIDDDVYVYTGVTSVGSDESNIGFILSNQRTKETKFYSIAGAEEFSACSSAEGVTQDLGYTATFPILLNINSQPTYFMSLKDNSNLVKMYAMVNVQQYQLVATGVTVAECQNNYERLLLQSNIISEEEIETTGLTGIITDIRSAVINGNTFYYFRLDNAGKYYMISAQNSNYAVLCSVGDKVNINYDESSKDSVIVTAMSVEILEKAGTVTENPSTEIPLTTPTE